MTKTKKIISYIVLILASALSAFPLYYMLCGATNTSVDVVRGRLIPGSYLFENFKTLIDMQNLGLAMFNSFRNAIVSQSQHCSYARSPDMDLRSIMTRGRMY